MIKLLVISTRTSLGSLIRSVEKLRESGIDIICRIYYTHELDSYRELIDRLREDIVDSDIILIDIRTPTSNFIKILEDNIGKSRARIILPLVVGSSNLMKYLKIGNVRGEIITKKVKELDFDVDYINVENIEKIMNMFEKIGRILHLGFMKDLHNYVKAVKYWTYGTERNIENLIKMILRNYFNIDVEYEEPSEDVKPFSIWIPDIEKFVDVDKIRLDPNRPTIGILVYSGMHFDQCKPVASRLYKMFRDLGYNCVIIVGGGSFDLKRQVYEIDKILDRVKLDILINLQWFRINGGPYGGPSEPTWNMLLNHNVLLINGLIMYMREVEKWKSDPRGISPIEVITGVALPEIDGSIEPIPIAGLSNDIFKDIVVIDDRLLKRVRRTVNWISLRYKNNSDKKIAIIIYNYPPGEDNVGSASYLDIFASLENILKKLKERNYSVDVLSKEELVKKIVNEGRINSPKYISRNIRDFIKVDIEKCKSLLKSLPENVIENIKRTWGSIEDFNINSEDGYILIPGIVVGNVFIGIQPSRGIHEDPDKVYHSKDLPPHYQYLTFYLWLQNEFKADAIIHLGTHGTLEFMPGKEVGLSSECYPDILIGDIPHIYVYHVTNPSEMTIAKRRSYAYIITHSTPPFTISELYGEWKELEELVHEYEEAKVQDPERANTVIKLIEEKCRELGIEFKDVESLHDRLFTLKRSIIPKGLHILGNVWNIDDIVEYLLIVSRYDREVKSLYRLIFESIGINYDDVFENPNKIINGKPLSSIYFEVENLCREIINRLVKNGLEDALKLIPSKYRGEGREILEYLYNIYRNIVSSRELESLLDALEGRYILPRICGDPVRFPEVFPTGCNGYAFDPRLVPSKAAYLRGIKIAEETLRRYYEKHGKYPETVSVVLWGFETMGTRGETIGQILHYLGVRLVRKHGPWHWELEPISLEELGRPRIDVVVTICGIFRDTFPNLITMIDRAVRLVASLDEPVNMNFVRKHYLEKIKELGDMALLRIFGPKDGAYNTRIVDKIETGNWRDSSELAETYIQDMSYAYGENVHAVEARELFTYLLSKVDMITQIKYANEYDITDLDHYYEFLGGLKNAVKNVKGSDVSTFWIDTTLEKIRIKDIREAIEDSAITRLLNPKWIESMLNHGYDGCREISKRVEYVLGLAATSGDVPNWVFDKIYRTYVENIDIKNRFLNYNPYAYSEILRRLYEAYVRGLWKTSEDIIEKIRREYENIEKIFEEKY